MTIEEMLRRKEKKWKAEGKAEAVIELLEDIDTVPDEIREKILNESDLEVLRKWHKEQTKTDTMEEFLAKM